MNNPYPEKIIVGDDIEVSNPKYDIWQEGYDEALKDAVKRAFSRRPHAIPEWLTEMAGKDLVDAALGPKPISPANHNNTQEECPVCSGTGYLRGHKCPLCAGHGTLMPETEKR